MVKEDPMRDTFTVKMTYSHPFTIFTPPFAPVDYDSYAGEHYGHAEKYWKLLNESAKGGR